MKICKKCKIEKLKSDFYTHPGMKDGFLSFCKNCINSPERKKSNKEYMRNVRFLVLQKYSAEIPFCSCCNETIIEFLGIDHIEGKGNLHRKELIKNGFTIYLWLRKNHYPNGFRVLCHNCNLSLGYNQYCPHGNLK